MAFDLGGALNKVLDSGLDIWVDTEKAKNYTPGAQTVGQRDASGGTIAAGQSSGLALPAWANNPAVMWGGIALAVVVVVLLLRKP